MNWLMIAFIWLMPLLWFCRANWLTYKHRISIIHAIRRTAKERGYDPAPWHELESISYDAHMFRIATLRNPWALYSPNITKLVNKP